MEADAKELLSKTANAVARRSRDEADAAYEEAEAMVTAHKTDDPGNEEELARLVADAKAKYSKTKNGKYQLRTAIDGVTTHERVKNAVEKCRTNLDVNQ